ncbi:MAG: phosphate signaling complex protein PhoU [Bacilli bacterium]
MYLEKEIENLYQLSLKMADLVEENLKKAIEIYYNYNEELASTINDDVVDMYERLIEELAIDIMLKERPYAKDLRSVTGILKLVSDLERMGDHAEDIIEFATKLKDEAKIKIPDLDIMVKKTMSMVHNSVLSFINKDELLAIKVIKADDEIDEIYEKILNEIIEESNKDSFSSSFAIYTTLVVKYIERIADHAVNVAEWVVYILRGYYKDKKIF